MIPFFNLPDFFNFPQQVRHTYDIRREHAAGNGNYRNALVSAPLELSLANLEQIEGRIETRISKDVASGTDMTGPIAMLGGAKDVLAYAAAAVNEATSTASIGLHPAFVNAHFALNNAKDALDSVVDAIATAEASSTPE